MVTDMNEIIVFFFHSFCVTSGNIGLDKQCSCVSIIYVIFGAIMHHEKSKLENNKENISVYHNS